MQNVEELEINTGPVTIRGKRWRQDGGIPTLCLHGFLDNAASFDLLAPKLKGLIYSRWILPGTGCQIIARSVRRIMDSQIFMKSSALPITSVGRRFP